jgi:hypothetical protein
MKDMKQYTRVTDVLYPFSGLKNVPPEILKNAAERGTKVHEICDALIEQIGMFNIDNKVAGYIESFNHYFVEKNFLEKPDRFFCDEHMITGECDAIYQDQKGLVLVDIKTSLREGKTWRLQGSAYAHLAERYGYKISRIEFVKLCKEGKEPKIFTYDRDFQMFLKCLDVYREFFNNSTEEDFYQFI